MPRPCSSELDERMTAEAPSTPPAPRPQCPRCGTGVPLVGPGIQVIRCEGCGAALQVSTRSAGPPKTPAAAGEGPVRPRRRPMVELSGPRRPEPQPVHTFTVELSQSDIETSALGMEAPPGTPARTPTPTTAPTSAPLPNVDTPWYAEDIERL